MPIYFQPISESLPFSLESIGNHWGQESISRKQGYAHYHWLQTESGQGQIQVEGKLVTLHPGEGVLLPPYTPHAYFADADNRGRLAGKPRVLREYGIKSELGVQQGEIGDGGAVADQLELQTADSAPVTATEPSRGDNENNLDTPSWQTRFVTFNGLLEDHFAEILGTNRVIFSTDDKEFSFSRWIDAVVEDLTARTLDPAQASADCYRFLMYLSKGYENQLATSHPLFQQFVLPTIETIETTFGEDLTVDSLAAGLFITPQYLTRLFRRFTGKTTQQYLLDFRLNKAKELLMNHQELSVQDIAGMVGFASASRFVQVFREKNGGTPRRFRRGE